MSNVGEFLLKDDLPFIEVSVVVPGEDPVTVLIPITVDLLKNPTDREHYITTRVPKFVIAAIREAYKETAEAGEGS